MDEYIKREDALKAIDRVRCEIHKPHENYVIGELLMKVFDSAFDACDRGINRIPAADVVEVAKQIFEEIETSLVIGSAIGSEVYYAIRANDYLHYKKKYTEGEPNGSSKDM